MVPDPNFKHIAEYTVSYAVLVRDCAGIVVSVCTSGLTTYSQHTNETKTGRYWLQALANHIRDLMRMQLCSG